MLNHRLLESGVCARIIVKMSALIDLTLLSPCSRIVVSYPGEPRPFLRKNSGVACRYRYVLGSSLLHRSCADIPYGP